MGHPVFYCDSLKPVTKLTDFFTIQALSLDSVSDSTLVSSLRRLASKQSAVSILYTGYLCYLLLPYLHGNTVADVAAYVDSTRLTGLKNSTIRKGKFCLVLQIRPRKLPFTSFPIHYSLFVISLDTLYP